MAPISPLTSTLHRSTSPSPPVVLPLPTHLNPLDVANSLAQVATEMEMSNFSPSSHRLFLRTHETDGSTRALKAKENIQANELAELYEEIRQENLLSKEIDLLLEMVEFSHSCSSHGALILIESCPELLPRLVFFASIHDDAPQAVKDARFVSIVLIGNLVGNMDAVCCHHVDRAAEVVVQTPGMVSTLASVAQVQGEPRLVLAALNTLLRLSNTAVVAKQLAASPEVIRTCSELLSKASTLTSNLTDFDKDLNSEIRQHTMVLILGLIGAGEMRNMAALEDLAKALLKASSKAGEDASGDQGRILREFGGTSTVRSLATGTLAYLLESNEAPNAARRLVARGIWQLAVEAESSEIRSEVLAAIHAVSVALAQPARFLILEAVSAHVPLHTFLTQEMSEDQTPLVYSIGNLCLLRSGAARLRSPELLAALAERTQVRHALKNVSASQRLMFPWAAIQLVDPEDFESHRPFLAAWGEKELIRSIFVDLLEKVSRHQPSYAKLSMPGLRVIMRHFTLRNLFMKEAWGRELTLGHFFGILRQSLKYDRPDWADAMIDAIYQMGFVVPKDTLEEDFADAEKKVKASGHFLRTIGNPKKILEKVLLKAVSAVAETAAAGLEDEMERELIWTWPCVEPHARMLLDELVGEQQVSVLVKGEKG